MMHYETPDVTLIEFEDNIFVTTELDSYDNKEVKDYIESQGGIVKNSVTKSTNYLIYEDGKEETTKYKKALELVQEKGLDIVILSRRKFKRLVTMHYVTPRNIKIDFEDSLFVLTGFKYQAEEVQRLIESRGGIVNNSVTKATNYLIYKEGEYPTTEYKKALDLIQEKELEINVIPLSMFYIACRREGLVEFGSYPFDKDGSRQPIWWSILKRDGNKALLLSVYGLDAKTYNETRKAITWETCMLRKWLNEEFYNSAFTEEEKRHIQLTNVKNPDNPIWNTPGGIVTKDKVFLLSLSEAKRYLPTNIERQVAPTPYAVKQGVVKGWNSNCWWWLRTPGRNSYHAARVNIDGDIDYNGDGRLNVYGNYLNYDEGAVCPALWIDLESEI